MFAHGFPTQQPLGQVKMLKLFFDNLYPTARAITSRRISSSTFLFWTDWEP
jgi:hypothetical protein